MKQVVRTYYAFLISKLGGSSLCLFKLGIYQRQYQFSRDRHIQDTAPPTDYLVRLSSNNVKNLTPRIPAWSEDHDQLIATRLRLIATHASVTTPLSQTDDDNLSLETCGRAPAD